MVRAYKLSSFALNPWPFARWAPAAVFMAVVHPASPAGAQCLPAFASFVTHPAGSRPSALAVADLNGDGYADIAVPNHNLATVSVLLNSGAGTFPNRASYPVGAVPEDVVIHDLDLDEIPDLAVANFNSGTVSVLLGKGDGTFRAATSYQASSTPRAIAVGDVNNDGIPDIAAANDNTGTLSVLLGNGDGSFQSPFNFGALRNAYDVALSDVNSDGKLDAIVGGRTPDVRVGVMEGLGDGTFSGPVLYAAPGHIWSLVPADLNTDGHPDIVVCNYDNNTVSILRNTGAGLFAAAVNYPVGGRPQDVVVRDVTGDGRADLLVVNTAGDNLSLLRGVGDATFLPAIAYAVSPAGSSPLAIAAPDLNNDGRPDVVTANFDGGTISVLLNSGNHPRITTQPREFVRACPASASISVSASGPPAQGPLTFAWFKDDAPIPSDPRIIITTSPDGRTSTLRISPVIDADQGAYHATVANTCGLTASTAAQLTLCRVDLSCDGVVDFADYLEFLNLFAQGDGSVDFNGDGTVDFADYLDFLNLFDAGC